jgi:hypothetical protein
MPCHCSEPTFNYTDYASKHVGVDETNGRHGDVTIQQCRSCGALWLKYLLEWEWYAESGRWYRGQMTPEQAESLTPQNAAEMLGALPWHFYGGSQDAPAEREA